MLLKAAGWLASTTSAVCASVFTSSPVEIGEPAGGGLDGGYEGNDRRDKARQVQPGVLAGSLAPQHDEDEAQCDERADEHGLHRRVVVRADRALEAVRVGPVVLPDQRQREDGDHSHHAEPQEQVRPSGHDRRGNVPAGPRGARVVCSGHGLSSPRPVVPAASAGVPAGCTDPARVSARKQREGKAGQG